MGLELVEIVMDVEQTFGVHLPRAETPAMDTVGQLHDLLVKTLAERPEAARLESHVFERVRNALESAGRASPGQIDPSTPLCDILPLTTRRRAWKRLQGSLPWVVPPLRRPRLVGALVTVAAIALAWACTFGPRNPNWLTANPAVAMVCLFYIGPLAAFFVVVGVWFTTPLAVVWRPDIPTVGDLASTVVAMNYGNPAEQRTWSAEEIWNTLRQIIVDVLGVDPAQVTPDARFVDDLGTG